jgi:hypothetical protein
LCLGNYLFGNDPASYLAIGYWDKTTNLRVARKVKEPGIDASKLVVAVRKTKQKPKEMGCGE